MSIFLAATSPNATSSHPLFIQRGLARYTQIPLAALHYGGIPHMKEIAYSGYKDNIDVFIASTYREIRINTTSTDCHLEGQDRPYAVLPMTTVGFVPHTKLTPDQETSLTTKLVKYNPVVKKHGATSVFILRHPTTNVLPNILKIGKLDLRPSPEFLGPLAYQALIFGHRILTEFLATNSYPAFHSNDKQVDKEDNRWELLCPLKAMGREKRSATDVIFGPRMKRVNQGASEEAEEDDDEMVVDVDDIQEVGIIPGRSLESVFVAKPSPIPASNNVGPPASVPFLPGLCFPYFDRMNIPDRTTIRDIMSLRFLRNFGPNREAQISFFRTIKNGLEELAPTKEGMALAHMYVGMELALQTQSRLFIVMLGEEYCGFCLLGGHFSVVINGQKHGAGSPEDLQTELLKMSAHDAALSDICVELSKLKVVGSEGGVRDPIEVLPAHVPTAHKLWQQIAIRKFQGGDGKPIQERLGLLAYNRSYYDPSVEMLVKVMRKLTLADKEPIDDETPMYLPNQLNLYNDPVAKLLSCFGPIAPSFLNTKGSVYPIPKSKEGDPNDKVAEGAKGKALPSILVALKPLHLAVADMHKFLKEKAFTMDLKERAARNRCIVYTGGARDVLYEELRGLLYRAEFIGKKRKAEDDQEGSRKKIVETAADVLGLDW